jgi:hypothetical protein
MKTSIQTVAAPLTGIGIIIIGFVYDVLFAGIPYQDPTPELQARYDFHSAVAGSLYKSGCLVVLLGLVAIPFILRRRGRTARR